MTRRPTFALCLALALSFGLLLAACGGGGSSPGPGNSSLPPVSTTQAATSVTTSGAVLNGTVNPNAMATEAWFEHGLSPILADASQTTKQSIGSGVADVPVSYTASAWTAATTYYYRVCASSAAGTTFGTIASCTTGSPGSAPTVQTLAAIGVGTDNGGLSGSVNPNGQDTQAWFEWGTDSGLSAYDNTSLQSAGAGSSAVILGASLSGLAPGNSYYYRVAAVNATGTSRGSIVSFTTNPPAMPPTVTTLGATNIGVDNATLNGQVNPNGLGTTACFEWGTDPGLAGATATAGQDIGAGNSNVAVNALLPGLTDNTTYYYRVVGTNSTGTSAGDIGSFTTSVRIVPPATQWVRTFGGAQDDLGRFVRQTADGGYVIAGSTASAGAGTDDVYLIKTDVYGNSPSTKTFGGTGYDVGYSVQQTSDGGYIIAGSTTSFGQGICNVYLIKTDVSGNVAWTKTFGSGLWQEGISVQQTSDGGYIVAGLYSADMNSYDVYLIKTDASGDELWAKLFGGAGNDYGYSVQQTSDGGYVITGSTASFGAGLSDVYLIKTDSSGNVAWTKTFGGTGDDVGGSVRQTLDGGYIIAGATTSFGAGLSDVYLIKTDSSGNVAWTKTFGGTGNDVGYSVQQTSDGGYVIAGWYYAGASSYDVYLIKTDASGDELWAKLFGGAGNDYGYSVQQTSDGGYVVAGSTEATGAGDVILIKVAGE